MMRWPHSFSSSCFHLMVVFLLLPCSAALGDTVIGQSTFYRASEGDQGALHDLQLHFFCESYELAAIGAALESEAAPVAILPALERMHLWPVDDSGRAWPVLDHGKSTFGWHRLPRIEYDSRSELLNSPHAFLTSHDVTPRLADWRPRFLSAGHIGVQGTDAAFAEARLAVLLLQPVWAHYRMHGELPETPGDAYRALGIALIEDAEWDLLERYNPVFFTTIGRVQLRLEPKIAGADRLEALAYFDAAQETFIIEGRRLDEGESFTENKDFSLRLQVQRFPGQASSTALLPELQQWSTWRDADIPVIPSPITDFLRHGPTISDDDLIALAREALREEALNASLRVGPKFENAESADKGS